MTSTPRLPLAAILKAEKPTEPKGDSMYQLDKNGKPTNADLHYELLEGKENDSSDSLARLIAEGETDEDILSLFR